MIDPINTNNISGASEANGSSGIISQSLIIQLIIFLNGCKSNSTEDTLKAELTQLEASLPPEQAAQLKDLLSKLPTDSGSKNYDSELTEAFAHITAFIASVDGLSPQQQQALNTLLAKQPSDTGSKDYGTNVAAWAAQVTAFVASNLPGMLSPTAQSELNDLLADEPIDTGDKNYPAYMQQFIDSVEVFLAKNLPSSLSPADKAKLDDQLQKIKSIDLDSKEGPAELQLATAQLQQMLSGMLF